VPQAAAEAAGAGVPPGAADLPENNALPHFSDTGNKLVEYNQAVCKVRAGRARAELLLL